MTLDLAATRRSSPSGPSAVSEIDDQIRPSSAVMPSMLFARDAQRSIGWPGAACADDGIGALGPLITRLMPSITAAASAGRRAE